MLTKFVQHYHMQLLICVIIVGTFLFAFFPPFEKPDEEIHFFKAIAVSQGNLVCKEVNGKPVDPIRGKVHQFVDSFHTGTTEQPPGFVSAEIKSCTLPFIFYLAPGAWHFLAEQLQIPLLIQVYVGRLINASIALVFLLYSLHGLPKRFQSISLFVFSLPMTMYQLSSYSKDSYHLGVGVFILNTILLAWYQKKISVQKVLVLAISMIVFILTRPQFFWIVFLFVSIPTASHLKQKLSDRWHLNILFIAITVLTTGVIIGLFISQHVYLNSYAKNLSIGFHQEIDPAKQIQYSIENPLQFFIALISSILVFGVFYLKGMIGILGPLERPLPLILYICYVLGGILVFVNLSFSKYLPVISKHIGLLLFVACASGVNIFIVMYLYATPIGNSVVLGVQGRYFLLLIPFGLMAGAVGVHRVLFGSSDKRSKTR